MSEQEQQHDQRFEEACQEIADTYNGIRKKKETFKKKIEDACKIKEDEFINTGRENEINTIGRILVKSLEKYGFDKDDNEIHRHIPDKYKRGYTRSEDKPAFAGFPKAETFEHLDYSDVKTIPESEAYFNQLKQAADLLKKPLPEYLTREQVAQLRDDADDITQEVSEICEAHKIATIERNKFNELEENEKTANKHKDKIQQEKSKLSPHQKLQKMWGQEVLELRDKYDRIAEGILTDNYVSPNSVLLEQLILKHNAYNSLLRPLTDRKFQRDWWEWCKILEDYHDQGGTYASSKSAVFVADIFTKAGKPEQRKITKEQIDATHDEYLNEMRFIVANLGLGGKFGRQKPDSINTLDKISEHDNIDPKTGKKISGTHLEVDKYMFTHEQLKPLDDGFNPTVRSIIDEMRIVIQQHRPDINDLFTNYQDNERGYRAKRAFYMHDKLSDKA